MNNKKNSGGIFGGIIAGIIMIIGGICLLWWNEGRTIKTQQGINEAEKNMIQVKSDSIDEKNEGKLIATNGDLDLSNAEELIDETFGVHVKSPIMKRTVEMYQWDETCETDNDNKEICTYKKVWSDSMIDSSEFQSGHTNPSSMLYDSKTYIAEGVKVGEFILPRTLIEKLSTDVEKNTTALLEEYVEKVEGYEVKGKYITNMTDEENPKIGDLRISFSYNDASSVSVLAVQTANTFGEYTSSVGTTIFRIKEGIHTGKDIVIDMTNENKLFKWLLRLGGTLLIMIGIGALLSPITTLANFVPIFGNVVSFATGLISFVLGLAISLVVIALAWFRYRPILSIVLIVIVVGLVVFLRKYQSSKAKIAKDVKPQEE